MGPMERTPAASVWYFIVGAGFIGFWLYMTLNVNDDGWVLWGMLGIAIAAAFYAARLTSETVRIGIWIMTGLFLGFVVGAAILEEDPMITATFITGAGAGLIAAGLPPYPAFHTGEVSRPAAPPAPRNPEPQVPAYSQEARPPLPPQQQQQWGRPGQGQQQQQDTRGYGVQYR